jgi:hypothetical protein
MRVQSLVPPLFTNLSVVPTASNGNIVSWQVACWFNEQLPYTYQLQVGRQNLSAYTNDGAGRVDDWQDTGDPVQNAFFAVDLNDRRFGKTTDLFYRLKLTTGAGDIYYSDPVGLNARLPARDAAVVHEMIRKERLRNEGQVGVEGYLLKAFRYGPVCPVCTDPVTGEVTNSHCQTCYGTGFQGGYFQPFPTYAVIEGESTREALNPQTNMSKPVQVSARMLAQPQIDSLDVFVEKYSDKRHFIHPYKVVAQHRGVPIALQVELRLAPYSDVIYSVPVPRV